MNPCTLNIEGLRIGLTATDVLFQMAASEISWYGVEHFMIYVGEVY